MQFGIIDRYIGLRLDTNVASVPPRTLEVVESERRLRREQSYGFIHYLWWYRFADGRSVASVVPGAGGQIRRLLNRYPTDDAILSDEVAGELCKPIEEEANRRGLPSPDRHIRSLVFTCGRDQLRRYSHPDCRRLSDETIPPASGLRLPTHCFPDGVVYGVVADGRVISVAHAHRSGELSDRVADVGIATAPGYRRRGFAQAALSALVEHYVRDGGGSLYSCAPTNEASVATAMSVGFLPYAKCLVVTHSGSTDD